MAGPFDHIHIKRNTHGSSNEISFDVLDAARDDQSTARPKQPTVMISAREGQGSYHGVSGSSTLSGQEEVERRKRRRRTRLVVLWALAIACVVAVVAVAVLSVQRHFADVRTFDERLESLVAALVEVDDQLAEIDTLMDDPVSEGASAARAEAVGAMPSLRERIAGIREDALSAAPLALGDQDSIVLAQIDEACAAREDMLAAAEAAFGVSGQMEGASARLNSVWNDVLASDQAAREASQHANSAATEGQIASAREETLAAQDLLKANLGEMQLIAQENQRINLSLQLEYLQVRIESLDYALATADAFIAGDREQAKAQNDLYNEKDAQAVAIAESLPLSPDTIVEESFDPALAGFVDNYGQARNRAIAADSVIRARVDA